MTFACIHCGASTPCLRPNHPCTKDKTPVSDDIARGLWEVCTSFGMGSGTYSWGDVHELERERFREGVRFMRGELS